MKAPKKSDKKIGSNNPAKKAGKSSGFKATDSTPKKRFDDDDEDDFDYNDLDNLDNFDEYIDDEDDY